MEVGWEFIATFQQNGGATRLHRASSCIASLFFLFFSFFSFLYFTVLAILMWSVFQRVRRRWIGRGCCFPRSSFFFFFPGPLGTHSLTLGWSSKGSQDRRWKGQGRVGQSGSCLLSRGRWLG